MIIAGITGGIGSGKTTVARVWEKLGARVMYADDIAKQLMVSEESVRTQLKKVFGDGVYLPDGSLNKPYLAEEAFQKGRVEELNSIVHPAVYRYGERLIEQEKARGTALFVKEAALLLKNGRPDGFDFIVVCEADEALRISRVTGRDGSKPAEVKERMAKQQSRDVFRKHADIVIANNGTLRELEEKAEATFRLMTGEQ
ncbi:MAG: dephospho-CoA kinase [Balneolia bacterium]|nr:dephospho-CoA kinase [Balneolia bacterium]